MPEAIFDTVDVIVEKSFAVDNSRVYVNDTAPCELGAVQLAVIPDAVIEVAVPTVGAFESVALLAEVELAEVPEAFTALTLTKYNVFAANPVTACELVFTVKSW